MRLTLRSVSSERLDMVSGRETLVLVLGLYVNNGNVERRMDESRQDVDRD
jgi:hypothetical protein